MKMCNDTKVSNGKFMADARLLSVCDIQEATGLNYRRALLLMKNLKYIKIGQAYFVSARTFSNFLNRQDTIEIQSDL